MNREQAFHNFWSGFGLTAYDENTVPEKSALPYLTYEVATASIEEPVYLSASLWYRSTSWEDATEKAEEIRDKIGYGGKLVYYTGGAMWIRRSNPFAQRMSEPSDPDIRRIVLQIVVEFLTED